MFISKKEKFELTLRVTRLESRIEQLARSLNAVLDAQTIGSDPAGLKMRGRPLKDAKPLSTKQKEELQRLKRNEYQRQYKKRKQAEQKAA
jgi:hypothetical protein